MSVTKIRSTRSKKVSRTPLIDQLLTLAKPLQNSIVFASHYAFITNFLDGPLTMRRMLSIISDFANDHVHDVRQRDVVEEFAAAKRDAWTDVHDYQDVIDAVNAFVALHQPALFVEFELLTD